MVVAPFIDFVLNQLPPPPRRVLEVGCGSEGGLVLALVAAGYDAVGVDPEAPEGERFVRGTFQTLEPSNRLLQGWDAVVAGRVLHHVRPLDDGVARLARLAPLLLVDEFARELIDVRAQAWYEERHRIVSEGGGDPPGPPDLDAWRTRHPDLHRHDVLLAALRARYDERTLEWLPYLHRWLADPASEALEQEAIDAGALPATGWRWAGSRRKDPQTG
jgi:SAM-dependent methyltransferase